MSNNLIVLRNNKMTITSLELVEQINLFRESEGSAKTSHDSLLKIIRDEFQEEISLGELNERKYYESGASKSRIGAATRIDVIEEDPRIREIYGTIIKELAICHVQ